MIMSLIDYIRFVKFSHTIFALPFVLATMAIASLEMELTLWQVFLILMAMATARSAAMGINRIIDRNIDAKNKRTQKRELVTGKISVRDARIFIIINSILFWTIAATFNYITLLCAPIILILFYIYPYLKQVTWLSHFFLGFVDGLAPIATWIALFADVSPTAFFLGLAMMCWIAGFDIIYALQDIEFDRKEGLYSLPACFGIKISLVVSGILHIFTLVFLYFSFDGSIYLIGITVMLLVLAYEHWILKPDDFSRVNMAFFNVNGLASLLFFTFTWLEVAIR